MAAKKVQIKAGPVSSGKEAEAILLQWLERVREGDVTGIAIVGACSDGGVRHESSDQGNSLLLLAGLEILKWRIVEERRIVEGAN